MRFIGLSAIGALGVLAAAAAPASATPLPAQPAAGQPGSIKVAEGCGFGWRRTYWGDCVPNRFRMHRYRPDTVIEEWDEYEEY